MRPLTPRSCRRVETAHAAGATSCAGPGPDHATQEAAGAPQEIARRHRIQQVRARTERYDGDWDAPTSRAVQRQVNEAFAASFTPKPQAAAPCMEALPEVSGVDGLEDDVVAWTRAEARQRLMTGDTLVITVAVGAMGRETTEQLYGPDLVRRALQLAGGARSSLMAYGRQ